MSVYFHLSRKNMAYLLDFQFVKKFMRDTKRWYTSQNVTVMFGWWHTIELKSDQNEWR